MTAKNVKSGFTMIELLVVVGMIMLLAAALTSSISGANRRARIQACITEAQEITNAILAYENYAKDQELKEMNEQVATKSSLSFILGEGKNGMNNEKAPSLIDVSISPKGEILDPWHRPYYVTIRKGTIKPKDTGKNSLGSYVLIPNYNRRLASEVEPENE